MKILVKNSDVVFQKATVIEQSYTRTFSQTGGGATVEMTLDEPVEPNMKLILSVSGDDGVVNNNRWNLTFDNISESYFGTIDRGVSREFRVNGEIAYIKLQRDSPQPISTGSVTINAKYYDNSSYIPEVIGGKLDIVTGTGEHTYSFEEPVTPVSIISVKAIADSGETTRRLSLVFYDENNVQIGNTKTHIASGNKVYYLFSTDKIASVKVKCDTGYTYTDSFNIEISH